MSVRQTQIHVLHHHVHRHAGKLWLCTLDRESPSAQHPCSRTRCAVVAKRIQRTATTTQARGERGSGRRSTRNKAGSMRVKKIRRRHREGHASTWPTWERIRACSGAVNLTIENARGLQVREGGDRQTTLPTTALQNLPPLLIDVQPWLQLVSTLGLPRCATQPGSGASTCSWRGCQPSWPNRPPAASWSPFANPNHPLREEHWQLPGILRSAICAKDPAEASPQSLTVPFCEPSNQIWLAANGWPGPKRNEEGEPLQTAQQALLGSCFEEVGGLEGEHANGLPRSPRDPVWSPALGCPVHWLAFTNLSTLELLDL